MEEERGSVASDLIPMSIAETIEGNEEGQVGQRRRRGG